MSADLHTMLKIRSQDAGELPPEDTSAAKKETDENKRQAEMLSELERSRRRMQADTKNPLEFLNKLSLNPVDFEVVESRLAPTYLPYLYHKERKISDYFDKFFTSKGLTDLPLHREISRLASGLDDLCYLDSADVLNSKCVERQCRRLYGIELALKNVTNKSEFQSKADWTLSEEVDMNSLESGVFYNKGVLEEARKRLQAKADLNKWVVKVKQ